MDFLCLPAGEHRKMNQVAGPSEACRLKALQLTEYCNRRLHLHVHDVGKTVLYI